MGGAEGNSQYSYSAFKLSPISPIPLVPNPITNCKRSSPPGFRFSFAAPFAGLPGTLALGRRSGGRTFRPLSMRDGASFGRPKWHLRRSKVAPWRMQSGTTQAARLSRPAGASISRCLPTTCKSLEFRAKKSPPDNVSGGLSRAPYGAANGLYGDAKQSSPLRLRIASRLVGSRGIREKPQI